MSTSSLTSYNGVRFRSGGTDHIESYFLISSSGFMQQSLFDEGGDSWQNKALPTKV